MSFVFNYPGIQIIKKAHISSENISFRPDRIQENYIYVCVDHYKHRAIDHVAEAAARGASAVVVSESEFNLISADSLNIGVYVVSDKQDFFFWLVGEIKKKKNLRVLALTGSTGKSTTLEWLYWFCTPTLKVYRNKGNFNNYYGVIDAFFEAPLGTDWLFLELGGQKPGEIAKLSQLVRPNIAVVTNCQAVHLENYSDNLDDLIISKCQIFDYLEKDGTSVYPVEIENAVLNKNLSHRIQMPHHFEEPQELIKLYPDLKNALGLAYSLARALGVSDPILLSKNSEPTSRPPLTILKTFRSAEQMYAFDLSCTSLPAFADFLQRLHLAQNQFPHLMSLSLYLTGPIISTSLPNYAQKDIPQLNLISELLSQLRFHSVFVLDGSGYLTELLTKGKVQFKILYTSEELSLALKNQKGPAAFQDCRSHWSRRILKITSQEDLASLLFPPF